MREYCRIADDVKLGHDVRIHGFVNLYGCKIGDKTLLGPFVEVQKNAFIGKNCKIRATASSAKASRIDDEVFVGHGVMFINDKFPRATTESGGLQTEDDWKVEPTVVKRGASIGSGAVIICGVTIGEGAMIGAGQL